MRDARSLQFDLEMCNNGRHRGGAAGMVLIAALSFQGAAAFSSSVVHAVRCWGHVEQPPWRRLGPAGLCAIAVEPRGKFEDDDSAKREGPLHNPRLRVGENLGSGPVFSPAGMSVEEFWALSEGDWHSRRSSHNIAGDAPHREDLIYPDRADTELTWNRALCAAATAVAAQAQLSG